MMMILFKSRYRKQENQLSNSFTDRQKSFILISKIAGLNGIQNIISQRKFKVKFMSFVPKCQAWAVVSFEQLRLA